MIALTIPCEIEAGDASPFVARLGGGGIEGDHQAALVGTDESVRYYQLRGRTFSLSANMSDDYAGDVIYVEPEARRAQRWIRARSRHNTLLVTEQCDQLCRMCSQPPKKTHIDQFEHFLTACRLAPRGAVIGFSGGEPTLHKAKLLDLLMRLQDERPDLSFHVLTNAQHFTSSDASDLRRLRSVLWGVPVYAAEAAIHDMIVGKAGAFDRLEESFALLVRSGAAVELRTVLTRLNADVLEALAKYVVDRLSFVDVWAVMQLERIGFAKGGWDELFYDHSLDFAPVGAALSHAMLHGVDISLYNFPLCTLPEAWRPFAAQSISDWKNKYLGLCESCGAKSSCAGFFEWHPENKTYERMGPL